MSGATLPAAAAPRTSARLGLALLVAGVVASYWPTLEWLAARYQAEGSLYAHGPLVPLVSLYLVYRDRHALRACVGPGSWWALAVVLPALLLHWAAVRLRFDSPSGFTLLVLIPGLVWLVGGVRLLKRAWFPCAFLVFAIPLPLIAVTQAAQVLKAMVLGITTTVLSVLGTGVEASGPYLLLPEGGRLLIDDECSGLRSLVALSALGVLMAGTSRRGRPWTRVALLIAALPIAVFANLCRVLFLCAVGLVWGVPAAARSHDPSSLGVYVVAIAAYVFLDRWLGRRRVSEAPS